MNWGASSKVKAQVKFTWPVATPDVAVYSTVEECLVALRRINLLDTRERPEENLELPLNHAVDTFSTLFVNTARECSAKFTVDQLLSRDSRHVSAMRNAYELLILSGRYSEARAFSDRWLASVSPQNDTLQSMVLSTLNSVDLAARPIRFEEVWERIEQLNVKKFWYHAITQANVFWGVAVSVLDTSNAYKATRWLAGIPAIVGDDITQTAAWQHPKFGAGRYIYRALQYLEKQKLMDSLRKSTDAYERFLRTLHTAAKLNGKVEFKQAQPLVADFWFPEQPSTPIPQSRTVSVIVTTGDNDCARCLGGVAMIRRLHDQFPTVHFTLLAQTRGYHGLVIEPPTPDLEAKLIDSIYRSIHGFPGSVAIAQTPFWRVDGLDRRRINEDTPNQEAYPTRDATASSVYLVDRNSWIVLTQRWIRNSEEEIRLFLDALVNQPAE